MKNAASSSAGDAALRTVAALEAEVALLQGKLAELHATDLVALRRSCASLAQHVTALAAEAAELDARVEAIETNVFDARLVAREVAVVAVSAGGAYGLHAILVREQGMPLWLRLAPFALAGAYALTHVVANAEARWEGMARRNAVRKTELLRQAELLLQRIDIMRALAQLAPPHPPLAPPPRLEHVAVKLGTPEELADVARAPSPPPQPVRGLEAV
jgi:hypothetical protein